ncbi:MAG TPA: sensor histidine kinase [Noviherbaspirillum sp.]
MNALATLRASLRFRLLAGTLVWVVASILIAGWGLNDLFRRHVEQQFDAELKTHLDQLTAQLAVGDQGEPSLAAALSDPRLRKPYSGLYWQIDRVPGSGVAPAIGLMRSRSLWDAVLRVPNDTPADGTLHRHRVAGPDGATLGVLERVVIPANQPDRPLRLIVAANEQLMREPVERFGGMLWLSLGVLGAGLISAAVIQVLVGLAPLQRLRQSLERVREGKAQQLQGDFPVEISPLIEEFNAVLTQNAEVVGRARTQAGNLAHALKTPLSVLANAAEAEKGEFAALVREQVEAARKQVDYQLRRARAAAAVRVPGTRTFVVPVMEGLANVMRKVYAERQLTLTIHPAEGGLAFRGEEQDLQEMLGNLLDNACKWASRVVELRAMLDRGNLVITVDDDGKGLPPAQHDAIFGRGVRADEQTPGSGLGLAIVDELARMYGGKAEISDSPLGGVRATLILPAAPHRG